LPTIWQLASLRYYTCFNRDSSVTIGSCCRPDGPGSIPDSARYFLHCVQTESGPHPASKLMGIGGSFPVSGPRVKVNDHPAPSGAEVKKGSAPTSHIFMAECLTNSAQVQVSASMTAVNVVWKRHKWTVIKTNSVAFSPQANYTDWSTATCRWNLVPTFVVSAADLLRSLICFLDRRSNFFLSGSSSFTLTRAEWTPFQTHCYSEKYGSAGNRIRYLGVSRQKLWLLRPKRRSWIVIGFN
jgi:hypothetical protein